MKRICLIIAILTAVAFASPAVVVKRCSCTHDTVLDLSIDSIDFRKDLTRVYGRLMGRPHTSHRIDASAIEAGGKSFSSTDIDGVDYKRYFQWEEDGSIPVEIDFPAMKRFKNGKLRLTTVRGESVTNITLR